MYSDVALDLKPHLHHKHYSGTIMHYICQQIAQPMGVDSSV